MAPVICAAFLSLAPTSRAGAERCIGSCVALRAEKGLTLGGGAGASSWRMSPFHVSALVEMPVLEAPRVGMLAGMIVETGGRLAVGAQMGLRAHAALGRARFAMTADALFAPYSLFGAGIEVGTCRTVKSLDVPVCIDLRGSAYFLGSDLPEDRVLAQMGLVIGAEFDVF